MRMSFLLLSLSFLALRGDVLEAWERESQSARRRSSPLFFHACSLTPCPLFYTQPGPSHLAIPTKARWTTRTTPTFIMTNAPGQRRMGKTKLPRSLKYFGKRLWPQRRGRSSSEAQSVRLSTSQSTPLLSRLDEGHGGSASVDRSEAAGTTILINIPLGSRPFAVR